MIDVGQGDSILIKTPDNKSLLVDSGEEDFARNVIRDLKINKIKKLDYLLLTHSDSDHSGGASKLLDEIKAKTILLSKEEKLSPITENILKKSMDFNINIEYLKSDDNINIGNYVNVYILSPSKISSDPNKDSIVFLMSYDKYSFVFTGDADCEIEKDILNKYSLTHCNFLKVGHHGSKTSSSEEFISLLSPDIAVISCGYKNRYGHPNEETIAKLQECNSKIYRTDEYSNISFYFNKEGIFISK
ncbi:MAG: ComEC/Rec2 family competence protein [Peptostreptococcus sp.]